MKIYLATRTCIDEIEDKGSISTAMAEVHKKDKERQKLKVF